MNIVLTGATRGQQRASKLFSAGQRNPVGLETPWQMQEEMLEPLWEAKDVVVFAP